MDIAKLIASPAALTLSLALLHFLWQGLALAVFAAAGLLALRRTAPNARYVFLLAVLVLMLASPIATFVVLRQHAQPVPPPITTFSAQIAAGAAVAAPAAAVRPAPSPPPIVRMRHWAGARTTWCAAFWAMGVVALSLRLLLGWIGLASLRRGETRPLEAEWQTRLSRLAEGLHFRRPVALLASARVLSPTLVGWLRPAILLPVCAVAGLTPEQLEAIIAHELAHLRRHDYLVNLLQSVIETLLFYHPTVWWVSRRIRLERECCCDDLAVAACGDAMVYARALTALGALPAPSLAPAATGSALSVRICRLLSAPAPRGDRRPPWLAGVVALAAVGLLVTFLASPAPAVAARRAAVKKMVAQVASAVEMYRAPETPAAPVPQPAPAAKPARVAPKRVSIDLRDASLSDVARALTKASGATIMMDKDLTGKVTIKKKNVTVDAVLDAICREKKGWFWRMDKHGVYYVSTSPFGGPAKDPGLLLIVHMYKLHRVSPQYVLYQLGLSDDPGPEGHARDVGPAARAARPRLLPDGITDMVAVPEQNALLVRGTVLGIAGLQNFLEDIDSKVDRVTADRGELVDRTYKLQFASPQYVVYQLGLSDDPGPEPFLRDPDFGKPLLGTARGGRPDGEGARRTSGLGAFLPEGITEIVAYPMLNSLLIRGTEEGVDKLSEFLKLIDRKPQQIVIAVESVVLAQGAAIESDRFQGSSNVWTLLGDKLKASLNNLVTTSQAEVTDSTRIATMNLLPAVNDVTTRGSDGAPFSIRLRLVPRINGDNTITLSVALSKQQEQGRSEPRTTTMSATVNVRDGETFALSGFAGSKGETLLVITPTIVPER